MMNYKQTLDYLFAQLPMYQRIGAAAYKTDLHNTLALCAHLGNPQERFLTIHVGGTNGKGSVSHFLAAVLQASGFKTGLYTSPHYKDFRERIKINGNYIPKKEVKLFVHNHRDFIEALQPSFFEMTVGMAFDYFASQQIDIAVIEVGLGGRLDSTNVISPLLSVITNISYDHTNLLGNTLPLIAGEKAGIIKPNTPIVIGEYQPEVISVFQQKAESIRAPLTIASILWEAHLTTQSTSVADHAMYYIEDTNSSQVAYKNLSLNANGPYQQKNLVTALQALKVLHTLPALKGRITEKTLREGLGNVCKLTNFMGRWQILGTEPYTIADSAHNEAGISEAMERVRLMQYEHLHIVTGFVNDKDIQKVLQLFPIEATYYFAKANIPRGLDAKLLQMQAAEIGLKGEKYSSVKRAFSAARRQAQKNDLILVVGSIFVVAEVI